MSFLFILVPSSSFTLSSNPSTAVLSLQNIWPHFVHKNNDKLGLTARSRLHISAWDKSTETANERLLTDGSLQLSALTDLLFSQLLITEQKVNQQWINVSPGWRKTVALLQRQTVSSICSSYKNKNRSYYHLCVFLPTSNVSTSSKPSSRLP